MVAVDSVDTVDTVDGTESTTTGFLFSGGVIDVEGVELALDVFTDVPGATVEVVTEVAGIFEGEAIVGLLTVATVAAAGQRWP